MTQLNECSVRGKYNANFFADLRSSIGEKLWLSNALGLESCDDSNHHTSTEVGDIAEGIHTTRRVVRPHHMQESTLFHFVWPGSAADTKSMMTECYCLLNKDHGVMMILSTAKPEEAFFYEEDPWSGVEKVKLPINGVGLDQMKGHERLVKQVFTCQSHGRLLCCQVISNTNPTKTLFHRRKRIDL